MTSDTLSTADKEFLASCEEEFKDRYTDKDEEFMKVFNSESSTPPIVDPWWVPNSGRRNDRRNNRRNEYHPYERSGNRDRNYQDRRGNHDRGYNDYRRRDEDIREGHHHQRRRYY